MRDVEVRGVTSSTNSGAVTYSNRDRQRERASYAHGAQWGFVGRGAGPERGRASRAISSQLDARKEGVARLFPGIRTRRRRRRRASVAHHRLTGLAPISGSNKTENKFDQSGSFPRSLSSR